MTTTMTIPLARSASCPPRAVFLRRRLATTLVLSLVFMIALLAGRTVLAAPDGSPASVAGRSQTSSEAAVLGSSADDVGAGTARSGGLYLVHQGDTLASIADDLAPEGQGRRFVEQLIALNGDAPLVAGERLVLPA
jgi:hypothetical protein